MIVGRYLLPVILFLCTGVDRSPENKKSLFGSLEQSLPCADANIPRYEAFKASVAPTIDGKPDEDVWKNSPQSSRFVDLVHGTPTHLDTRAAVLWDEKYLYVAYWIEEPKVRATHTKRDAPIYQDNDVELFIAGRDGYYEFEINAYATIYEVLFFWEEAFVRNGYSKLPEFDLSRPEAKPFNGVGYRSHPRGKRIGFWNWDFP
ncbi:MAG TPA: carbohydrate-binding family 9-like protein, partial [Chryseosolibacter sp.]|nr:carbohydrate-binding family 9-like protein [Chryseosolibacter sp.]